MKAKYFKKIRESARHYVVRESALFYGDFDGRNKEHNIMKDYVVYARNEEEACERYQKKIKSYYKEQYHECDKKWGYIMVTPVNPKPGEQTKYYN